MHTFVENEQRLAVFEKVKQLSFNDTVMQELLEGECYSIQRYRFQANKLRGRAEQVERQAGHVSDEIDAVMSDGRKAVRLLDYIAHVVARRITT